MGVTALAHEAAGLKRQVVRGEWSAAAGTAAGSPNHGAFERNPQVLMPLPVGAYAPPPPTTAPSSATRRSD